MHKTESGSALTSIIIVILALTTIGALVFGLSASQSKNSYKTNFDQKVNAAVNTAVTAAQAAQQAKDAQANQSPYKVFTGTSTYGSISFSYPKTWSSYVDLTNQSEPIDGYFNPGDIPGVSGNSAYALRLELVTSSYSQALQNLTSQVSSGTVTAVAYLPPKMKGVANAQPGTLFTGTIQQNSATPLNGEMLIIPVRDKTLELYTLSDDNITDFNNIVLATLTYVP